MLLRTASTKGSLRSKAQIKLVRQFTSTPSAWLTAQGDRLILGIESSCDDSCAALLSASPAYSASSIASSSKVKLDDPQPPPRPLAQTLCSVVKRQDHSVLKGIHPLLAQHYHMRALPLAIQECLERGGVSPDGREVDAIAVTQGPGLAGCLGVGLTAAKTLAATWRKPLIPVHHMEAHALTPFLTEQEAYATGKSANSPPLTFPFLTLLVSGGHTMIVLARAVGDYQVLATTYDDSIGDAIDKFARQLCIPTDWSKRSPGASLEAFAASAKRPPAGSPSIGGDDCEPPSTVKIACQGRAEFSYGGIKTLFRKRLDAVVTQLGVESAADLPIDLRQRWAASFQDSAIDQIIDKVRFVAPTALPSKPISKSSPAMQQTKSASQTLAEGIDHCRHLVVSGGVACNSVLRQRLREEAWREQDGRFLIFPPLELCVDNAAMIAHVGALTLDAHIHNGERAQRSAFAALSRAKWSLEELGKSEEAATAAGADDDPEKLDMERYMQTRRKPQSPRSVKKRS